MKYLWLGLMVAACGGGDTIIQGVHCESAEDCDLADVAGTCEATGFCSYPDSSCAGGARYSPGAGDLASTCVGGGPVCGAVDEACCEGTTCGDNLACTGGICACGDLHEPCCGGSTCNDGLSCESGSCTSGVVSAAIGKASMCLLLEDGTVECWGHDAFTFSRSSPHMRISVIDSDVPQRIANATNVVELQGGEGHTCARKADGSLWCWGHNEWGQLGDGTNTSSLAAVQVSGLSAVTAFTVGRMHTCAIGTVAATTGLYCWGRNGHKTHALAGGNGIANDGRLGTGSIIDTNTPAAVDVSQMLSGSQTITSLSAGGYSTCAVTNDNKVWCWGTNTYGQLGTNSVSPTAAPAAVDLSQITIPPGVTIDELVTGNGYVRGSNTCIRLSDGTVYCWGPANNGQLGNGNLTQQLRATTAVTTTALAGATFTHVATLQQATCGIDSTGKVWCWGKDQAGQLGNNDGTFADQPTPVQVIGVTAAQLFAGHRTVCALDSAKHLACWGNNRTGVITRGAPLSSAEAYVMTATPLAP